MAFLSEAAQDSNGSLAFVISFTALGNRACAFMQMKKMTGHYSRGTNMSSANSKQQELRVCTFEARMIKYSRA